MFRVCNNRQVDSILACCSPCLWQPLVARPDLSILNVEYDQEASTRTAATNMKDVRECRNIRLGRRYSLVGVRDTDRGEAFALICCHSMLQSKYSSQFTPVYRLQLMSNACRLLTRAASRPNQFSAIYRPQRNSGFVLSSSSSSSASGTMARRWPPTSIIWRGYYAGGIIRVLTWYSAR